MKFIYKDILRFLDYKPSKESLSEKLFQLGHEHEVENDTYDMELTPNRGDCLSLNGIARDLNIFYGLSDHLEIFEEDMLKNDQITIITGKIPDPNIMIPLMGYDNSTQELEYNIREFLNNILEDAINEQEKQ